MRKSVVVVTGAGVAVWGLTAALAAQAPKPAAPTEKVAIVSVTGCLKQQGTDWMLSSASEPEASVANATVKKDAPPPALGKRQFKLIGVTEYNLASMKDHTVTVKALHVKATPTDRLNLTSVLSVSATCGAATK